MYRFFISSKIFTLYLPICIANSSLKFEYSKMSAIRNDRASANVLVRNRLPSNICRVAVFEFSAANF